MTQFNTIDEGDEGYDDLVESLQAEQNAERFDYNGLANAYNTRKINGFIHFEFPKDRQSSLRKQLERRGLVIGVDCTANVSATNDPFEKDDEGNYKLDKDKKPIPEKDADGNVIPVEYSAFVRRLTDKQAQIIQGTSGRKKKDKTATETAKTGDGGDSSDAGTKDDKKPAGTKPAATGGKGKGK